MFSRNGTCINIQKRVRHPIMDKELIHNHCPVLEMATVPFNLKLFDPPIINGSPQQNARGIPRQHYCHCLIKLSACLTNVWAASLSIWPSSWYFSTNCLKPFMCLTTFSNESFFTKCSNEVKWVCSKRTSRSFSILPSS